MTTMYSTKGFTFLSNLLMLVCWFSCIANGFLTPLPVTSTTRSIMASSGNHQKTTKLDMAGGEDDDDDEIENDNKFTNPEETSVNVLGTPLRCCCDDVGGTGVGTGFYRNGYCSTGEQDLGRHTVCCQVSDDFLEFSKSVGNDLSTPMPNFMFPGLKDGDVWCLCAQRWAQAYNAGKAPKIFLQATHEKTLDYAPYEILKEYAIDKDEADKLLGDLNRQRDRLNKLL